MAFYGSTGRSQEQEKVNKLETLGNVIHLYSPTEAIRLARIICRSMNVSNYKDSKCYSLSLYGGGRSLSRSNGVRISQV